MKKKGETIVAVGTRKGLFVFESRDRRRWKSTGPHFEGNAVFDAALDPRDGKTIAAAVTSMHWGPTIARTTNFGARWKKAATPPKFHEKSGLSVQKIWNITPGEDEGEWWAGAEPAGLFRSVDGGDTWSSIDALNLRPDRAKWMPGGGGLCLHTVLPYPNEPDRMLLAASAVGVFGSHDRGQSWRLMNGDVRADYSPEKITTESQIGSCPHALARDAANPDIVYMQNHCGVYRRRRGEKGWTDISKGLPSRFGFPIAAHPRDAGTVYAVPLAGDFNRVVAGGAMAVYRTTDGGKRWSRLSKGLPQKGAYHTVLRAGMSTDANDPAGVYVGTTTGQLYASRDEGAMWTTIADGLPPILSVDAALAWPTRT